MDLSVSLTAFLRPDQPPPGDVLLAGGVWWSTGDDQRS